MVPVNSSVVAAGMWMEALRFRSITNSKLGANTVYYLSAYLWNMGDSANPREHGGRFVTMRRSKRSSASVHRFPSGYRYLFIRVSTRQIRHQCHRASVYEWIYWHRHCVGLLSIAAQWDNIA